MAFVSTTAPNDVVLVKCNKVNFSVQTDRRPFEFSQKLLQLTFTSDPAVDDTLEFSYDGVTVFFTVKNPADDSGAQFSTNAGALALTDYLDLVADEIAANFDVINNFEVTRVSTNKIMLIVRNGFDPDFVIDDQLTNCTAIQTEQTNANYEPNLALYCGVEIYDILTGKWEVPLWHVLPAGEYGHATFDIHKDFDLGFHVPSTSTIGSSTFNMSQAYDNKDKFRIKYAEYYGEPATVKEIFIYNQEFVALNGGKGYFNRNVGWWYNYSPTKQWLTLQSTTKTISYDQPEWLYWIGREDPDVDVNVKVQATLANGTVETEITLPSTYTITYQSVYILTTQYKQLTLTLNPANPIKSYQVWLVEAGTSTKVSDVMTYVFDNTNLEYERFYLFGNSYAGCDVVRGTGKIATGAKYVSQLGSVPDVVEDSLRGEYFQFNKKQITTFKGSIGYKDKEEIEYLKDMLLSNDVRLIDTDRGVFLYLLVLSETVKIYKDDDDLYFLEWDYRYAFDDCAIDDI